MSDQSLSRSGLYAYTEAETVNLRDGVTLIMDWWSDAQMVAAPSVAAPLQLCRRFRTLEEHTRLLTSSVPELRGQETDVMNVLGMVRDAGLLVSAESVCDKLNLNAAPAVDLTPTRAFIITCDRPAAIDRLLETMLRGGGLSRHEALFLVDDSRDPGNAERNRELVAQFNLTSPRDMVYFGATEANQLMAALIAALPEHEEGIRFLIDRDRWKGEKTYGLARNLCLLLSVGRRAIVMDDDVLFQVRRTAHRADGVDFGADKKGTDFFASEQDMLQQSQIEDFDPLTGHASCLGLTMGQALSKLLGRPVSPDDLANANSSFLNLWDADSPVLISQCGTLGDPGSTGTDWLYLSEGETAQRISAFPGGMQQVLENRHYWLGHQRPAFGKMAVMSQVTGLDNSHLLPPYFPVFRGEDYLFGAMTEFLFPHGAVLSYPWAVPHVPLEQRSVDTSPPPRTGKGGLSLGKYVTDHTVYRRGISATARLQQLATMARELSQSDDRALKTLYRKEIAEMQGLDFETYSRLLNDGIPRSPEWQGWLSNSLNTLNSAMQQTASVTDLRNVDPALSEDQILARFRDYAGGFASSLAGWDAIRQAAGPAADALLAGDTLPA